MFSWKLLNVPASRKPCKKRQAFSAGIAFFRAIFACATPKLPHFASRLSLDRFAESLATPMQSCGVLHKVANANLPSRVCLARRRLLAPAKPEAERRHTRLYCERGARAKQFAAIRRRHLFHRRSSLSTRTAIKKTLKISSCLFANCVKSRKSNVPIISLLWHYPYQVKG